MKKYLTKAKTGFAKNRELLVHSFTAFTVRGIAAVASFFMNLVITRSIGAEQSGYFFLCFALVTIISTITRFGADNVIIKQVSISAAENDWPVVKASVKSALLRSVLFSLAVAVVVFLFARVISVNFFKKPLMVGVLQWMSFGIPLVALYTLYAYAFQGLRKVLFSVSLLNVFVPFLSIIIILLVHPSTSQNVGFIFVASSLVTVVCAFVFWGRTMPAASTAAKTAGLDAFWKSCYALWTVTILQQLVQWGGQFIAGFFSQGPELAKLAIAQRTSMLISFVLISINLVSAPRFATLYKNNEMEQLKKYARTTARIMTVFATPIVLFLVIFPGKILQFFGPGFTDASLMLRVLCIGQYINVITGSVGYLLMMTGHEKDVRSISILNGVVALILSFVLTWFFGVTGSAVAIAVSVGFQNVVTLLRVKKRLGFYTISLFR